MERWIITALDISEHIALKCYSGAENRLTETKCLLKSCEFKSLRDNEASSRLKCIELLFVISFILLHAVYPISTFYQLELSNISWVCVELDYKKQNCVKLPLTEKRRVYPFCLERIILFNNRCQRLSLSLPDHTSWINRNSNRTLMRKVSLCAFSLLVLLFGLWKCLSVSLNLSGSNPK